MTTSMMTTSPMSTSTTTPSALENVNVAGMEDMPTPDAVHASVPVTGLAAETVARGRETVRAILDRRDPRLFVVVGPCSIHDPAAALDYAGRLARLAAEVRDTLFIVMRVYFEKPRTSTVWKGFINSPLLADSFRID